jgi:GTP-binding protein
VNDAFHFVDLPGYGYARVSKAARNAWRPLIEGYLRTSEHLRGVVQLIDARHPPSDDDQRMMQFLASLGVPTIVVATKVDKLKRSERDAALAVLAEQLGIDDDQLIPFSAHTGEGRDELAQAIVSVLAQPSWREE